MAPLRESNVLRMQANPVFGGEKTIKKDLSSPVKSANLSPKLTRQVGRFLKRQAVKASRERQELNAIGGEAAILGDMSKVREMQEEQKRKEMEKLQEAKCHARCLMEQAKPAVPWLSIGMDTVTNNHDKHSKGMFYNMEFPWTEDLLAEYGPEWFTAVLHKTQVLAEDNEVVEIITGGRKITAGNNGAKSLFEVRYKRNDPELDTKLFAKLPYPMTPATRTDRISSSVYKQPMDWGEINTYRLFEANLPFKTPKYYYGDISAETSNFCLILGRIPFAELSGLSKRQLKSYEVEGPYDKCKDWMLKSPSVEYYKVLAQKIAMVGGAYQAGTFAPKDVIKGGCMIVDPRSTAFKESLGRMMQDPKQYKAVVNTGYNFMAKTAKYLYPKYCQEERWEKKYRRMAMLLNAYAPDIQGWKEGEDCDYFRGIGHMNLNMDNAYFWRDENRQLDCGVLDWGGFGVNNIAHKLWWSVNCSEFELVRDHHADLITVCLETFEQAGGAHVDFETFKMAFMITALQNFMQMVGAIPNSLKMCKASEFDTITEWTDPRVSSDVDGKSTLRTTLWVLLNGVRLIGEMNADKYVEKWLDEVYVGKMGKKLKPDKDVFGPAD